MKKISDWMKTWTVPQAIATVGALVCVTALAISITVSDGWGKLVTWLADGQHQALLLSLAAFLGALYHRALGLDPKLDATPQRVAASRRDGSAALEVLGAIAFGAAAAVLLLPGCGNAATTVPLVIGGAQVVLGGVCTGAEKLCEQNDPACGSGACHAAHTVCPVLSPTSPVQITCDAPAIVATTTP